MDVERWKARMIELATVDLRERQAEELCMTFAIEFVRIIDAITWALDDGRRPPREIHREASELASKARDEVHARISRYSPDLAGKVVVGLSVIKRVADELLGRMTPGAVAWWKTLAPPPAWMPEVKQASDALFALFKGLQIDRLQDFTSADAGDLQSDALESTGREYNRQMEHSATLLPAHFDFAPIEASFGVSAERAENVGKC